VGARLVASLIAAPLVPWSGIGGVDALLLLQHEPGIVYAGESSGSEEASGRRSTPPNPTARRSTTTYRKATECSSAVA
jgi:hypothetical protein